MATTRFLFSRIGCAVALATASMLTQAAAVYSMTATSNTDGNTPPGTDVLPGGIPSNGDFLGFFTGTTGSTFFHTYGFSNPIAYFGARVSGDGTFYGKTTVGYSDTFTNLTGGSLLVSFTFTVDSGGLSLAGSGTGFADLDLILKFNGTTVARDHTRVDGTTCNSFAAQDVGVLSGYQTCADANNASGNSQTYTVSQLLLANEILNIDYMISSEVSGAFVGGGSTYCSGSNEPTLAAVGGDGGDDGAQTPQASNCQFYNALARSGDPAGFGTPPFVNANFSLTAVPVDVPEPASLALSALALTTLAGLRRRTAQTRRA